jgi:hypothetical protein
MRYIYVDKAGKMDTSKKAYFFTSQKTTKNSTIFHRNAVNNRIRIPQETINYYFTWNRHTGKYSCPLSWDTLIYGGDVTIDTTVDEN